MRRRDFIKALGVAAGALVVPPALLLPERKRFFLPPAGGWPRFHRDDCIDAEAELVKQMSDAIREEIDKQIIDDFFRPGQLRTPQIDGVPRFINKRTEKLSALDPAFEPFTTTLYMMEAYDVRTGKTDSYVQVDGSTYRTLHRWCNERGIPLKLDVDGRLLPVRMDEYQCL